MSKTLKHLFRYVIGLEPAHTQTTEAERLALQRYASRKKRIAEIGVYEGFTTAIISQAMASEGELYAIDPFFAGRLGICWSKWIAKHEVARAKAKTRVKFVEKFSYEAASLIKGDFDFIFIDGDHSLNGIQRDWADFAQRVSPGGIMALHDTRVPSHNPNVAGLGSFQYFEEHIRHDARYELLEQVDSLSVLRRKVASEGQGE